MWQIIISNIFMVIVLGVLVLLYMRQEKQRDAQKLEKSSIELKNDIRGALEATNESFRSELRHLQNQFGEHMRHQSDVLQKTNTHLNERMDKAAQVIGDVHRELGKMTNVARSIDELQNILKAPKLRGGLGELFLGDLLQQILPSEHFALQHRFKSGEIVDAVIYLGEKIVPIDSKFPLENFKKSLSEANEEVSKQARRVFINDVKKHIQAVAKYIRTDEGTYDFALMYIPAENLYYEIAVKEEVGGEAREVLNYALKQKVIPVSPNTLYAYLMTIIVGLKGMRIEKHAEVMLAKMGRIQKDFESFQISFNKVGTHIDNASKSYQDAEKRFTKVDGRLHELVAPQNTAQIEVAPVLEIAAGETPELQ